MKKFLQIALNLPLFQTFTYLDIDNPENHTRIGCRADIKFGNRRMIGYIIAESNQLPEDCPVEENKIRPILKIIDKSPILTSELLNLAKWISKYYLCSYGEAVSVIIPSAKRETDSGGFSVINELSPKKNFSLSIEQKNAVDEILSKNSKTNLHYLYGPTGSGKTEVFLQTAEKLLNEGKGVIYLVPEISLTQQVVEAVVERFGQTVAVLHSGLSKGQKLNEWNRILTKEARVVIGARSAVFAPVPDLGMIIIDEEHDGSYKSGSTPRYHARQVAMYRCANLKIPLLMGSATPSVEAWYMMTKEKIIRHNLTKRLSGGVMPKIVSVDLTTETLEYGCISKKLFEEVKTTINEKRQTILFLNRRGFSHFFRCNSCGYEQKCKNCSISMTYHKNENQLRCHYCGWKLYPPQQCPQCGSLDIGYSGFGTEFIESEVKAKFPNARIVRIDTDNLTKKGELQEKLAAFKNNEYDIMLGTQMIAKGLNFPNLKLVGVILADTGLHLPDFRAAEKTFSLITQVAGRAGRYFPDGKVIVQTYNPNREPILFSVNNEIQMFYDSEIETRKLLNFPPFSRIIRLVFRAPTLNQAEQAAYGAEKILKNSIKECLEKNNLSTTKENILNTEILGPSECPIVKISQNYRFQIILKGQEISILQKIAAELLFNYTKPNDVYIECDVDPITLL